MSVCKNIFLFVLFACCGTVSAQEGIFRAVNANDTSALVKMLTADPTLVGEKYSGFTAMHFAARDGRSVALRILLDHSAKIDETGRATDGDYTPLMLAISNNQYEAIIILLERGANEGYTNGKGLNAATIAHTKNDLMTLSLLKDRKYGKFKYQAFMAASANRFDECKNLIAQYGLNAVDGFAGGWYLIHYAARMGNQELVDFILKQNRKLLNLKTTNGGATPLSLAVVNNHTGLCNFLVKAGADITIKDNEGHNPVEIAHLLGNENLAEVLIDPEKGMEAYVKDQALFAAIKEKSIRRMRLALEQGANTEAIGEFNNTPLAASINLNILGGVALLLEKGAKINASFGHPTLRKTPLTYAVDLGYIDLVQLLLRKGADTSLTTADKKTAVAISAEKKFFWISCVLKDTITYYNAKAEKMVVDGELPDPDFIKLYLKKGRNLDFPNEGGHTLLHIAAGRKRPEWIAALLIAGADKDKLNKENLTAYSYLKNPYLEMFFTNPIEAEKYQRFFNAAAKNDTLLVKMLIKNRLDLNMPNHAGLTALHISIREDAYATTAILLAAGADGKIKSQGGYDAAGIAALNGNYEAFLLLYQRGYIGKPDDYKESKSAWIKAQVKDPVNTLKLYKLHKIFWEAAEKGDTVKLRNAIVKDIDINAFNGKGYSALHLAASKGHLHAVKLLIGMGANINLQTEITLQTPIMLANKEKYTDVLQYLLFAGSDYEKIKDYWGNSLYDVAGAATTVLINKQLERQSDNLKLQLIFKGAQAGRLDYLKLYESDIVNINMTDELGETLLCKALSGGHTDIVDWLLEKGAGVNKTSGKKARTPLMVAAEKNDFQSAKKLIQRGGNKTSRDQDGATAGQIALERKHVQVGKWLSGDDKALLSLEMLDAVQRNDSLGLKKFLALGADPNARLDDSLSFMALHFVARENRQPLLPPLLKLKANVNAAAMAGGELYTPLMLAAYNDCFVIADLLVRQGADPAWTNQHGKSAVSIARERSKSVSLLFKDANEARTVYRKTQLLSDLVKQNQVMQAVQLLDQGVEINAADRQGYTALHHAVLQHSEILVKTLLGHGADVNSKNAVYTPLMLAAMNNDLPTASLLLDNRANAGLKNSQDSSAADLATARKYMAMLLLLNGNKQIIESRKLMEAVIHEDKGNFAQLLASGIDLNAKDEFGYTAIHYAASYSRYDMGVKLINAGANVNEITPEGNTPLMLSAINGHWKLAYLLLKNGDGTELKNLKLLSANELSVLSKHRLIGEMLKKPDSVYVNLQMLEAVSEGNIEGLQTALRKGAIVNFKGDDNWAALAYASRDNYLEILRLLLQNGADAKLIVDTDMGKYSLLMLACKNDAIEIVKLLLDHGADVALTLDGRNALTEARANYNYWPEQLIAGPAAAYIRYMKCAVLKRAIESDDVVSIKEALLEGATLKEPILNSQSPFIYAVRFNSVKSVKYLLSIQPAAINEASRDGYTPLMIAANNDFREMAVQLIAMGADLKYRNKNGEFALGMAEKKGYKTMLNLLRSPEAFTKQMNVIKAIDADDKTALSDALKNRPALNTPLAGELPLLYAIKMGRTEAVTLLLKAGADPEIKDSLGKKPLDYVLKFEPPANLRPTKPETENFKLFMALTAGRPVAKEILQKHPLDWYYRYQNDPKIALAFAKNEQLVDAVYRNNLKVAEDLLKKGADADFYDEKGISMLTYALSMQQDSLSDLLLRYGASSLKLHTLPALEQAAFRCDSARLAKLLLKGVKLNSLATEGSSPLHFAVRGNCAACVKMLLARGANPNLADSAGASPLMILARQRYVAEAGKLEICRLLINAGANIHKTDAEGNSLLSQATNAAMAREFIRNKVALEKVNYKGYSALHLAIIRSDFEIVRVLIGAGANVNQPVELEGKNMSPLMLAVKYDCMEAVISLYQAGSNFDYADGSGNSAYTIAREAKNIRMLRFLANPVKSRLDYLLGYSVNTLDFKNAKELLEKGADIDVQDALGNTLLHNVLSDSGTESKQKADFLILNKASVLAFNQEGNLPLHEASTDYKRSSIAGELLTAGADPNAMNKQKKSALQLAVENGNLQTAWLLMKSGAKINQKTVLGESLLNVAQSRGNISMVEVLEGKTDPFKIKTYRDWKEISDRIPGTDTDSLHTVLLYTLEKTLEAARKEGCTQTDEYNRLFREYVFVLAYNNRLSESLAAAEDFTRMLKAQGKNTETYRESYLLQAMLFEAAGNNKKAIEVVKTAIALTSKKGTEKMGIYAELARLYTDSTSLQYYKRAIEEAGGEKIGEDVLMVQKQYADALIAAKDKAGLKLLYKIEETNRLGIAADGLQCQIYSAIINEEYKQKNLAAANLYLDKMVAMSKNASNLDIMIGNDAALLKRYEQALFFYNRATLRKTKFIAAKYCLLRLYLEKGEATAAISSALELNKALAEDVRRNFLYLSEEEKYNLLQEKKMYYDLLYSTALRYPGNKDLLDAVTNNALFNKGALVRSALSLNDVVGESKDEFISDLYKKWKQVKQQLESQYVLKAEERTLDVGFLEEKVRQYEKGLYRYTSLKDSVITWEKVKSSLKADESAIEFISFKLYRPNLPDSLKAEEITQLAALIISPEKLLPVFVPLCEEEQLSNAIHKGGLEADLSYVNRLYVMARGNEKLKKRGQENAPVYNLVWKPMEKAIGAKRQLYLSLSGTLNQISFAALPYGKDSILIDRYNLKYLRTTASLGTIQNVSKNKSIALFGGIDYEKQSDNAVSRVKAEEVKNVNGIKTTRGTSWKYLPGTLTETEKITKLFKEKNWNTDMFISAAANEQRLKSFTGRSPTILHIATHGYFFPAPEKTADDVLNKNLNVFKAAENPLMRSGLLLAGANTSWKNGYAESGKDDGILTAYEVSNLNLKNTDLVVLSACETGLGDIKGSEGVYGLQRAFNIAGAHKLVMSLWQVPDSETAELMTYFYGNLIAGENYFTAFNLAQKEMRKKYPPFFWAAFVLVE